MRPKNDYCNKRFERPVERRARQGRRPLSVRVVQAAVLAVGVIAVANIVPKVAKTTMTAIRITGAKYIDSARVIALAQSRLRESRFALLPQQVAAYFDVRRIRHELQKEFPFASWLVSRDDQGGLRIAVHERSAQLVWQSQGKLYYLDQSGQAFAEVISKQRTGDPESPLEVIRHEIAGDGLPIIQDALGRSVNLGAIPLTADVVEFIVTAADTLGNLLSKQASPVVGYAYDASTRQLTVHTVAGYDFYLTSDQSVDEQCEKVRAAIAGGIPKNVGLQYIDVRFGQKIFYQ